MGRPASALELFFTLLTPEDDNCITIIRSHSDFMTPERIQEAVNDLFKTEAYLKFYLDTETGMFVPNQAKSLNLQNEFNFRQLEGLSNELRRRKVQDRQNKKKPSNLIIGTARSILDPKPLYLYVVSPHTHHDGKSQAIFLNDLLARMNSLPIKRNRKLSVFQHNNPVEELTFEPVDLFEATPISPPLTGHKTSNEPFLRHIEFDWETFEKIQSVCRCYGVSTSTFFLAVFFKVARDQHNQEKFQPTGRVCHDSRKHYVPKNRDSIGCHVIMDTFKFDVDKEESVYTIAQRLSELVADSKAKFDSSYIPKAKGVTDFAMTNYIGDATSIPPMVASSLGYHQIDEYLAKEFEIDRYWCHCMNNNALSLGLWSGGVKNVTFGLTLIASSLFYDYDFTFAFMEGILDQIKMEVVNPKQIADVEEGLIKPREITAIGY